MLTPQWRSVCACAQTRGAGIGDGRESAVVLGKEEVKIFGHTKFSRRELDLGGRVGLDY